MKKNKVIREINNFFVFESPWAKKSTEEIQLMTDIHITEAAPPKMDNNGIVTRHPKPAPSKSAKYILPAYTGKCFSASARHKPLKKKGKAINEYFSANNVNALRLSHGVKGMCRCIKKLKVTEMLKKSETQPNCVSILFLGNW